MIVADPFGSWVKGAHEGTQDAIALREAQDRTAQNAYNLQRSSQFDPQELQILRDKAATSGLELGQNEKIYGDNIPYHTAQAELETRQLNNTQIPSNMGIYGPLFEQLTHHGAQLGAGGLAYPNLVQSEDGTHPYVTPLGNVSNRFQASNLLRSEYQQARIEAQERGQDLSYEKWAMGKGMIPQQPQSYLGLPQQQQPAVQPPVQNNLNSPINLHAPPQAATDNIYGIDPYAVAKKANTGVNTGGKGVA